MSATARQQKRIAKDITTVKDLTLEKHGVYVDPSTFDKSEWHVFIQGPVSSVWEKGVFKLKMSFPDGYPFSPVKINFAHGIYHPNVGSGGTICLDIIKKEAWSPSYTLVSVFQSIRSLLSDPNPDSPMNGDSARAFKSANKSTYEKAVHQTIQKFGQEVIWLKRQTQHSERPDEKVLAKLEKENKSEKASSSGSNANSTNVTSQSSDNNKKNSTVTSTITNSTTATVTGSATSSATSSKIKSSTTESDGKTIDANSKESSSLSSSTTAAAAKRAATITSGNTSSTGPNSSNSNPNPSSASKRRKIQSSSGLTTTGTVTTNNLSGSGTKNNPIELDSD